MNRLDWFELRANADRHSEEVEILQAEISRCRATFDFLALIWTKLAVTKPQSQYDLGVNAYVHKTASNYRFLRDRISASDNTDRYEFLLISKPILNV